MSVKLPRVLGVIPARGGSKRVPRKNLRPLGNSPLICHTIKAAIDSKYLTCFVVSTDSLEVADEALKVGAYVVKRPDDLASDDASSSSVVLHALNWMGHDDYDIVVCLHPTSPIRNPTHIDECISILAGSSSNSIASVECRKRNYTHNASIYAVKVPFFLEHRKLYTDESIPYLMDRRHSLDIDTEDDWKVAETWLKTG